MMLSNKGTPLLKGCTRNLKKYYLRIYRDELDMKKHYKERGVVNYLTSVTDIGATTCVPLNLNTS